MTGKLIAIRDIGIALDLTYGGSSAFFKLRHRRPDLGVDSFDVECTDALGVARRQIPSFVTRTVAIRLLPGWGHRDQL
jgi:hypothetical protein